MGYPHPPKHSARLEDERFHSQRHGCGGFSEETGRRATHRVFPGGLSVQQRCIETPKGWHGRRGEERDTPGALNEAQNTTVRFSESLKAPLLVLMPKITSSSQKDFQCQDDEIQWCNNT